MYRGMARYTLNAVVCIQVLVKCELEHRRASLSITAMHQQNSLIHENQKSSNAPRSNHAIRQEENPDSIPPLPILLDHLILVRHPVLIPPIERGRIMHTKYINVLHLKPSGFELIYDPAQRTRSVSAREDIFVHEKAPNEIFILPTGTNACDLKNKNTIVIEEIINLTEERAIATDTDVLKHLSTT